MNRKENMKSESISQECGIYKKRPNVFVSGNSANNKNMMKNLKIESSFIDQDCDFKVYPIYPNFSCKDILSIITHAIDNSNKIPKRTILYIASGEYFEEFRSSLEMVSKIMMNNGSHVFTDQKSLISFLNQFYIEE